MKDKNGIIITNTLQKIVKEYNLKPNKIWVDKDYKFYNKSMKSWLEQNGIELYYTRNEVKSFFAERITKTLKNNL